MEKKVLFLDMDGTTLDDENRMPGENIEALERAIKAGHQVVVTTGRPAASALLLLETYGLNAIGCRYVIAYNGGLLLDYKNKETLFSRTLPVPSVLRLAEEARALGLYFHTYEGDRVLTERADENLAHYIKKTGMEARVVPALSEALKEEPYKALAIDFHGLERMKAFQSRMKDWADMVFSSREYLDIVPRGVNKGRALEAFCKSQGIPIEHTVAAGDENNDVSMLRAAGVGCAVANAVPAAKEAADYVALRDNNHCAVAEIVERFLGV